MDIHREIYLRLERLLPGLCSLEIRKEPCLLTTEGHLPVNVHVTRRDGDRMVLLLGSYPFDRDGHIVPAPEVEIVADMAGKKAVPVRFSGTGLDVEGETVGQATCSWLKGLERAGFRFCDPGTGADCSAFPFP